MIHYLATDWLFFPPQASEFAKGVDQIFFMLLVVSGTIILILLALIGYGLLRRRPDEYGIGRFLASESRKIEISWMVIPTLAFMLLFAWGAHRYLTLFPKTMEGRTIYIIGRQWMWQTYYPNGYSEQTGFTFLWGEPVRLILASEDVIHSFYVPAFRQKHDVLPGKSVQMAVTPTQAGRFRSTCAEFCGAEHSLMSGDLVVLEPEEYARWEQGTRQRETLAARGERLYRRHGCSGCHESQSTVAAPALEGLYGRRVKLSDGRIVEADIAYLRDSILLPGSEVVAGFEDKMPSFQGVLDESDLIALLAYLQKIGNEKEVEHVSE